MSQKKFLPPVTPPPLNNHLKHLVGFDLETPQPVDNSPASVTKRLKELVRKIEDLNRRVDRLNDNF